MYAKYRASDFPNGPSYYTTPVFQRDVLDGMPFKHSLPEAATVKDHQMSEYFFHHGFDISQYNRIFTMLNRRSVSNIEADAKQTAKNNIAAALQKDHIVLTDTEFNNAYGQIKRLKPSSITLSHPVLFTDSEEIKFYLMITSLKGGPYEFYSDEPLNASIPGLHIDVGSYVHSRLRQYPETDNLTVGVILTGLYSAGACKDYLNLMIPALKKLIDAKRDVPNIKISIKSNFRSQEGTPTDTTWNGVQIMSSAATFCYPDLHQMVAYLQKLYPDIPVVVTT